MDFTPAPTYRGGSTTIYNCFLHWEYYGYLVRNPAPGSKWAYTADDISYHPRGFDALTADEVRTAFNSIADKLEELNRGN